MSEEVPRPPDEAEAKGAEPRLPLHGKLKQEEQDAHIRFSEREGSISGFEIP